MEPTPNFSEFHSYSSPAPGSSASEPAQRSHHGSAGPGSNEHSGLTHFLSLFLPSEIISDPLGCWHLHPGERAGCLQLPTPQTELGLSWSRCPGRSSQGFILSGIFSQAAQQSCYTGLEERAATNTAALGQTDPSSAPTHCPSATGGVSARQQPFPSYSNLLLEYFPFSMERQVTAGVWCLSALHI